MTTIFALNAVSSLLATVGIGGLFVRKNRQARRHAVLQPVDVTARTLGRPPRRCC